MIWNDRPYNNGQFKTILSHLTVTPEWLILGGPGDGNEAQTARQVFSNIKIIGIEPNINACTWQRENGWPNDAPLLEEGLWISTGTRPIYNQGDSLRNSTINKSTKENYSVDNIQTVPVTTLDTLDEIYGPFNNAILWIDIEGSEYEALRGATSLLERKAFILLNIEEMTIKPEENKHIRSLMTMYGYIAVHHWENDTIYVRNLK